MTTGYHANTARQLDLFKSRAPKKPYCASDMDWGVKIRPLAQAICHKYLQANGPTHKYWLIFDIDRPSAAYDWQDMGCPEPTIITINPANGHAHLFYGLEVSVRTSDDARAGPLRFAAAVECALREKLWADAGYCGLIAKNPLHSHWITTVSGRGYYDLQELSEWLDLSQYNDRRRKLPAYGLGRNCTVFDDLRKWAYRAIRQGWPDYRQWLAACEQRAVGINAGFKGPMPQAECRHIAKSVAKWTHKHITEQGFSEYQAAQGHKGGVRSGEVRREASADKAAAARALADQGMTQRAIAEQLGAHRNSVANWLK